MKERSDLGTNGYPPLLAVFLSGNLFRPLIDSSQRDQHRDDWRAFLRALPSYVPSDSLRGQFHVRWHECHHFLRELVNDDGLLVEAARAWLPPYAGLEWFFGVERTLIVLRSGAWALPGQTQRETATMFASGLNALGKGGIVLRVNAPAEAILAGPSPHSANWLRENEYTVDTARLMSIEPVERFPPAYQVNST